MPISVGQSLLIMLVVSLTIFSTRAIPFLIFHNDEKIPDAVRYLGRVLPPAVIGMLMIYCLKGISILDSPFGIPELLSVVVVAVLHIWKRNNLISIGVGTVLYMFLIQCVF